MGGWWPVRTTQQTILSQGPAVMIEVSFVFSPHNINQRPRGFTSNSSGKDVTSLLNWKIIMWDLPNQVVQWLYTFFVGLLDLGNTWKYEKKILPCGNNFKQIQNKLDIGGEKKLAQFKNFKLFHFVKCDVLCAARHVKLFSMFILHVQNSTMPEHLVQPPTCGQRAQRARAESPRAPCAAGRCHDPKTGRPARVEQVGCAMAGPPCDKIICFDSNNFLTSIKRTPLVHQKGRIAWIWMVRRCKVQIDERDYFSGVTMCQNWFHSACMYWAQTFVSKDMRSEVLQIAIVEYESIGVPVIMEDLIKCTVQWIRICGL